LTELDKILVSSNMNASKQSVEERYSDAIKEVEQKLASLDVVCGRKVNLKGLRGWIFEQTVRTCIEEEIVD